MMGYRTTTSVRARSARTWLGAALAGLIGSVLGAGLVIAAASGAA
jgi:hypothetical protein